MKINWGTAILLSFIAFASFIGYWVYKIQSNDQYDYQLVEKNYYQEELLVNERYDALELAKTWSTSLNIEKNEMGLKIFPFPEGIVMSIYGYRQSDKSLDFKFKTQPLKSGELFLSDTLLKPGIWNLTFSWIDQSVSYQIEKKIYY